MKQGIRLFRLVMRHPLLCTAAYGAVYMIWFFLLERTVTNEYHIMHCRLDDVIPYEPAFVYPYFFWFAYMAAAFIILFLKDREAYARFGIYLALGMSTALVICMLFPNGTDLRPADPAGSGITDSLIRLLHRIDTRTNVFPSIHVINSVGVHTALTHSAAFKDRRGLRAGSFISMVLICLSTVFLKQHSVLDVCGGLLLSSGLIQWVYAGVPAYSPRRQNALSNIAP